jgi:hypothetical protein
VFNLGEEARTLGWNWKQLGLNASAYQVRDLWQRKNLGPVQKLSVLVKAHGTMLLRVEP